MRLASRAHLIYRQGTAAVGCDLRVENGAVKSQGTTGESGKVRWRDVGPCDISDYFA